MVTREKFDKLVEDVPEDGFRTLIPLIMDSFTKKRGRNLDRTQVAALAVGLMEMSATIDSQVTYIGELQAQLESKKESKLWQPR